MSAPGERSGFFGEHRAPAPSNQSGNTVGPQRDAWGQPIEKPAERQPKLDDKGNPIKDDNNAGIDDADIDDIWSAVRKENSQPNGKVEEKTTVITEKIDPKKQMEDYLASVGLEPITFTDAEKAELQAGNFDNMMAKVNSKIQAAHVKSLSGTKTLIEEAVRTAVQQAVGQSAAEREGMRNKEALNSALPWTKDKALGPVAQTVMQRFLDRGASTEKAIEGVKLWAKRMNMMADPERDVNPNRNISFRSGPRSNTGDEGAESWLDILGPQKG